jgi:hypothetical protein
MLVGDELYIATRRYLIDYGMRHLNGLGADHICKVCIQNGGSCCRTCSHLIKRLNYLIKDFHEFHQAIKNIELHKWGEKTTQV